MRLNDLLHNEIKQAWDTTPEADYQPLPSGQYEMEAVSGELGESRKGKPRYVVKWCVCDGEHSGGMFGKTST